MLALNRPDIPATAGELEAAITEALAEVFELPPRRGSQRMVTVSGGKYPWVKTIAIDLSETVARAIERIPLAAGKRGAGGQKRSKPAQSGPRTASFTLRASPISYQRISLDVDLSARDVQFDFAAVKSGVALMINGAKDGRLRLAIGRDDLDRLALEAAQAAARGHGVAIEHARVDLHQQSERSLAVDAEITARKVLSATLHIAGRIDIDDELNLRLSKLTCAGKGMVGTLACGLVRPQLQRFDGRAIPLNIPIMTLGELRLSDLTINATDKRLELTGRFGD